MNIIKKTVKNPLFFCFLVAFALRFVIYLIAWYQPELMMGAGYMGKALAILDAGKSIYGNPADPVFQHPVGYGLILSFFQLFTNNIKTSAEIVRIISILLDSIVCLLIPVICNNWLDNRRAGLIGAWIYAICYPMIVNTVSLHPDSLAPFCVASLLALSSLELKGWKYGLPLAGVLAGAFYYLRSEMLPFGLVLAAAMLLQSGVRKRVARIGIMLLCNIALIIPWLLFTWVQVGTPVLNSTNAWGSAYEALGQYPDNPWGIVLSDAKLSADAKSKGFESAWSMKANEHYKGEFLKAVGKHPDYYARLIGRRVKQAVLLDQNLFFSQTIGGYTMTRQEYNRVVAEYSEASTKGLQARLDYLKREPKALLATNPSRRLYYYSLTFLLVVSVFGMFVNLRKWRGLGPLLLFYLYYVVSISIIKQVEPKNMYALFPLLAVFTGLGIEWIATVIFNRIKHKKESEPA